MDILTSTEFSFLSILQLENGVLFLSGWVPYGRVFSSLPARKLSWANYFTTGCETNVTENTMWCAGDLVTLVPHQAPHWCSQHPWTSAPIPLTISLLCELGCTTWSLFPPPSDQANPEQPDARAPCQQSSSNKGKWLLVGDGTEMNFCAGWGDRLHHMLDLFLCKNWSTILFSDLKK